MATDSTKSPDTIATTIHDPRLPERSGWTNAEIIWEQIQEAAAECERKNENAEASELWRGAMELAREHLPPHDLRVATSMANLAIVERREGDNAAAKRGIEEALALWDAAIDGSSHSGRSHAPQLDVSLAPTDQAPGRISPLPARALSNSGDRGAGGSRRQTRRPPRPVRPTRAVEKGAPGRFQRLAKAAECRAPDRFRSAALARASGEAAPGSSCYP